MKMNARIDAVRASSIESGGWTRRDETERSDACAREALARRAKLEDAAVTVIQKEFRRFSKAFITVKYIVIRFRKTIEPMALRIQCAFRQFSARQRVRSMRARLAATLKLQRMYRAWKWRRTIESFVRNEALRAERERIAALLRLQWESARKIQAVARFYIFRRSTQHKVIQERLARRAFERAETARWKGIFYFVAIRAKEAALRRKVWKSALIQLRPKTYNPFAQFERDEDTDSDSDDEWNDFGNANEADYKGRKKRIENLTSALAVKIDEREASYLNSSDSDGEAEEGVSPLSPIVTEYAPIASLVCVSCKRRRAHVFCLHCHAYCPMCEIEVHKGPNFDHHKISDMEEAPPPRRQAIGLQPYLYSAESHVLKMGGHLEDYRTALNLRARVLKELLVVVQERNDRLAAERAQKLLAARREEMDALAKIQNRVRIFLARMGVASKRDTFRKAALEAKERLVRESATRVQARWRGNRARDMWLRACAPLTTLRSSTTRLPRNRGRSLQPPIRTFLDSLRSAQRGRQCSKWSASAWSSRA